MASRRAPREPRRPLARVELEQLTGKYRVLVRLRAERDGLEASGITTLEGARRKARRAHSRALARRFPGALRELELPLLELSRRLRELERLSAGKAARQPRWIGVMLDFHALWREALAVKAWLGARARGRSAAELLPAFRRYFARSSRRRRALAGVDEAFLIRYLEPPGGRLLAIVWQELEGRHGLGRARLEQLIFGTR